MLTLAALCVTLAQAAPAQASSNVSVTVYSAADPGGFDPQRFIDQQRAGWDPQSAWSVPGFGVVRQTRSLDLPKGQGWVAFDSVAQFLDPTSVRFTDLADPGTRVIEQRLEFDLVNGAKLLQKYIDREVVITRAEGDSARTTKGTLLSASSGQAVVRTERGIEIVPMGDASVQLATLPEGLRTQPTLMWHIASATGGQHPVRIDYMTGGLTWRADYNLAIAPDETIASLSAWVTLLNVSGASWKNAELRLIAGSVQRVQPQPRGGMRARALAMEMDAAGSGGFQQESFGEYHRYTLPFQVDLPANSTQQIVLFPTATNVKVTKELLYDGSYQGGFGDAPNLSANEWESGITQVRVLYLLANDEASGLGMPLPAGKVRVMQSDTKGSSEFIGEDLISHTPKKGDLRLTIGDSFDVTGKRTRMEFSMDSGRKMASETFDIVIKNGKNAPATVRIRERMWRWSSWSIAKAEVDGKAVQPTKTNASTIEQVVTVPAEGSTTFRYTVQYTW